MRCSSATSAGVGGVRQIGQQVHTDTVDLGGDLHPEDQSDVVPRAASAASSQPSAESWSVSATTSSPRRGRSRNQLRRRQRAVGGCGVGMQVDPHAHTLVLAARLSPNVSSQLDGQSWRQLTDRHHGQLGAECPGVDQRPLLYDDRARLGGVHHHPQPAPGRLTDVHGSVTRALHRPQRHRVPQQGEAGVRRPDADTSAVG